MSAARQPLSLLVVLSGSEAPSSRKRSTREAERVGRGLAETRRKTASAGRTRWRSGRTIMTSYSNVTGGSAVRYCDQRQLRPVGPCRLAGIRRPRGRRRFWRAGRRACLKDARKPSRDRASSLRAHGAGHSSLCRIPVVSLRSAWDTHQPARAAPLGRQSSTGKGESRSLRCGPASFRARACVSRPDNNAQRAAAPATKKARSSAIPRTCVRIAAMA